MESGDGRRGGSCCTRWLPTTCPSSPSSLTTSIRARANCRFPAAPRSQGRLAYFADEQKRERKGVFVLRSCSVSECGEPLVLRVTQESGMELALQAASADDMAAWKLALDLTVRTTGIGNLPASSADPNALLESIDDDSVSEAEDDDEP